MTIRFLRILEFHSYMPMYRENEILCAIPTYTAIYKQWQSLNIHIYVAV